MDDSRPLFDRLRAALLLDRAARAPVLEEVIALAEATGEHGARRTGLRLLAECRTNIDARLRILRALADETGAPSDLVAVAMAEIVRGDLASAATAVEPIPRASGAWSTPMMVLLGEACDIRLRPGRSGGA